MMGSKVMRGMKRRQFTVAMAAGALMGRAALAKADTPAMQEVPSLADKVKAGLPPVDKRIPTQPSIVETFYGSDGPGRNGGECNMLIANARDTRLMTLYANTRLIVYDDKLKLHPDVLASYEVKEGREFTLKLRAGHKWSDGAPFTTEDFRYFWEDVANNKELTAGGPNVELLVHGEPPKVDIIDDVTIRYTWAKPNPYFIPSQARAAPLWLFRPSHYLKKFHIKYTSLEEIAKQAKGGQGQNPNWTQIHRRVDVMYNNDNPDLPTLNPWVLTTVPPAQRFIYERNPYYYRIDSKGTQLPYFDRVIFTLAAANLVPAKAGLGEADLQCRYLNLRDYTFLRKSAKTSGVEVRLWEEGSGSQLAFYPNLNAKDEVWRAVNRDVRFRRALSLAIDRDELNQVIYTGLAKPSNNTIMARSPLFKPEYASKWATHDPKQANTLLDEAGLNKRNDLGFRLLADGREATIVVEHQSEEASDTDAMSLVADHWKKVGIKMLFKPQSLNNFRLRAFSGEANMTAYAGLTTALPSVDTSPKEFAPTMLGGLQWPRWGMFIESKGKQGEKCDMKEASQLLDYLQEWEDSADEATRGKVWDRVLDVNMEQVFSIGTVNGILQPIVVGPKVRNVPKEGFYAYDPGGYIGLYKPDTFWFAS
jgi:peptide/nickel transport system substrate-binding protein